MARRWLTRDALNRAWRTILQGLLAVVVLPAATAGLDFVRQAILDGNIRGVDWPTTLDRAITVGVAAAIMSLLAYLHRAKLDPTRIPSAQPPMPPGVPPSAGVAMSTAPEVRR